MSTPAPTSPVSSIVALVLGIGLAVVVSGVFAALGWGGELASQTAGGASGAAPLIVDGIRQRRGRNRQQETVLAVRNLPNLSNLLVGTAFGFAVLITDNLLALICSGLARFSIWLSKAPDAGWLNVYLLLNATVQLPVLLLTTFLYAVAAAHRLGAHPRRWLLLGVGVYVVVRVLTVLAMRIQVLGYGAPVLILGGVLVGLVLIAMAMLGAARARRSAQRYHLQRLYRRLPDADQQAVLALIAETAELRTLAPPDPARDRLPSN